MILIVNHQSLIIKVSMINYGSISSHSIDYEAEIRCDEMKLYNHPDYKLYLTGHFTFSLENKRQI